ncbi:uncharacterized protein LOC111270756 isoform X1 [Varroa jacobsoni]|nr:uncharacterized protein LOC111270756 isoform X1 [Varroa jacobsoni]
MLYTLCTTLSFIMFILITSFAFLEANRSLLDSSECIRVVNVQPSLKNAGTMEKITTASVSAAKVGDVPSFAGRRRNCGKGLEVSRIILSMISFMHWINRQSLLHSVRLLETIRVTPYLRSFHSTKVTQPKLNPELSQSRKPCQNLEVTPVRKKPLGKRKQGAAGNSKTSYPFRRHRDDRESAVRVMESSTQPTDTIRLRARCYNERLCSLSSWRTTLTEYKRKSLSLQSKFCKHSTSLSNDLENSRLSESCVYFETQNIVCGTPTIESTCSSHSDDSWRELGELIDQAVNRRQWSSALCACCASHHTESSRSFASFQSQTDDTRFTSSTQAGFRQIEMPPPSNVLGTLLSWNDIWSEAQNDALPNSVSSAKTGTFFSSAKTSTAFTPADNASSQLYINDCSTTATSRIIWPLHKAGKNHEITSSRNLSQTNVPLRISSTQTPIGNLRNRRIFDGVVPSIWSPTWQPSSGDPEFTMTSPLMLHSNTEYQSNERPFSTFLGLFKRR